MWGPAGRLRDLDFPIWVKICCNWGSTSTPGELRILRRTNFMKKLQKMISLDCNSLEEVNIQSGEVCRVQRKVFYLGSILYCQLFCYSKDWGNCLSVFAKVKERMEKKQPYCQAKPSVQKERRGLEDPRWRSAGGPCWPRWDRPATWWTSRRGLDHSGRGGGESGDEREEMWKFLSLGSW